MIRIMTAINNPNLNEELKKENNIELVCKDIQYKEGILEVLEKNIKIDYIIIDEKIPGEINLEKLVEKIIEINEKIKIIIAVKKENKININFENENIIKIFYENKINLNVLKKYKNELKNINKNNEKIKDEKNKKIEKEINKKNKTKIITFLGEERVGKTMTMLNIAYLLKKQNYKILIIELSSESADIRTILKVKKNNKKIKRIKLKLKNKYKIINKKFSKKYIDNKIVENMILKINSNINIISYNKLIKSNFIEKVKNNYNYILIEINYKKNKILNKKILKNSNKKFLIINPNLIGIKNGKKIIKEFEDNKLEILINNYNEFSIEEKIIKNIFCKNKIIGKIKHKKEYENLINKNFKSSVLNKKIYKKDLEKVIRKII